MACYTADGQELRQWYDGPPSSSALTGADGLGGPSYETADYARERYGQLKRARSETSGPQTFRRRVPPDRGRHRMTTLHRPLAASSAARAYKSSIHPGVACVYGHAKEKVRAARTAFDRGVTSKRKRHWVPPANPGGQRAQLSIDQRACLRTACGEALILSYQTLSSEPSSSCTVDG